MTGRCSAILADAFYGRNDDGTYDPVSDRYFLIGAADQHYKPDIKRYLARRQPVVGTVRPRVVEHRLRRAELRPLRAELERRVPTGPFRTSASAPTVLEVATTYDPATPYRGALRTAATLGNVRLLTMRGDGHTAYGGNSACIDDAVNQYIETLALPAVGTVCQQDVPFAAAAAATAQSLRKIMEYHVRAEPHSVPR